MPLRPLPAGTENLLLVAGDGDRANAIGDSLMMLGYSIFLSADPAETIRQLIIGTAELEYLAHHEHVAFLRKPVSLMDLATGVRSILDKQGPVPLD